MNQLTLSKITLNDIKRVVQLKEFGSRSYDWTLVDNIELTPREQTRLTELESTLDADPVHLLNESTIWARAIYPLLQLSEQDDIRALSGVSLQATYQNFSLDGIADGVIGRSITGRIEVPYIVMVEAKRGIEGQNPIAQLYGELLVAARLNWEVEERGIQEVFGCYTIADSWTFVRAIVTEIESDRPTLTTEHSREYAEKTSAFKILKILKSIIQHSIQ
ncbi:MAG: hypothetical protein LH631_07345 [Alkalinema sp. CAN_BIN05]|nr:hypothetical protein [Alkalinema sp. CAN_BIN05]